MSNSPSTRSKNKGKTDSVSKNNASNDDFTSSLVTALTDDRVIEALQNAFTGIVEKMSQEISSLKQIIDAKDQQIQSLNEQLDDVKQQEKRNTIRIDGMPEVQGEENVAETVSKFVSEKLDVPLMNWELESVFRVGKKNQSRNRRIIVRLLSHDKKKAIMKNKKKLHTRDRHVSAVYVNDDLTEQRGLVFKTARQAVKDKRISSAWVFDGKVYVKVKETDDPVQVKSLSGVNAILSSLDPILIH